MKKLLFIFAVLNLSFLFAQTSLKSIEEDYLDFLSLDGTVSKKYLGYRTLSDSVYSINNDIHLWNKVFFANKINLFELNNKNNSWFSNGIDKNLKLQIFGPTWFNSYNTSSPYGKNDGALWQGKGYNSSFSIGSRLEALGFELTLKPLLTFSQNSEFAYASPNDAYKNNPYKDKASLYGYYGVHFIDLPQRFGVNPFFTYDWGDTEVRWNFYNFTLGFGTQSIWLGPAKNNPIIHSNNAASYPKFDIGLRKTSLKFCDDKINLGEVEFRIWWGRLSESEYFDNIEENNHNLISGLSFYYKLPFTDLSFGINRTMLSPWGEFTGYTLFNLLLPFNTWGGGDDSDQRFSVTADWLFEKIGLQIYVEWGRNDYSPSLDYIIRYPFHTAGFTFGLKKQTNIFENLKGVLYLEVTHLECSMDYDRLINWYTSFYIHHKRTQGYTNKGQFLATSFTGGNSQYIGYSLYSSKWKLNFSFERINPDLDYTAFIDTRKNPINNDPNRTFPAEANIRVQLITSVDFTYLLSNNFILDSGISFMDDRNYLNVSNYDNSSTHRYNFNIKMALTYLFGKN